MTSRKAGKLLPALPAAQRDQYAELRDDLYKKIWEALPEVIDGAIALAKGVSVTDASGGESFVQPPDLDAIRFLTETVNGRPKQPIEGNHKHSMGYDDLLEQLLSSRKGGAEVQEARTAARNALSPPVEGSFTELEAPEGQEAAPKNHSVVSVDRDSLLSSLLNAPEEQEDAPGESLGGLFK